MLPRLALLFFLSLGPCAAAAQTAAPTALAGLTLREARGQQPLPATETPVFAALGRISYRDQPRPGTPICSGVLVAPDLVLTAAHCVIPADGQPRPQEIRFAPAYRAGQAPLTLRGTAVIAVARPENPVTDLALLRLEAAVPATVARPLPLGPDPAPGEALTLLGYRRDAPELPMRDQGCRAAPSPRTEGTGLVGLTCTVTSGNSGGPVLSPGPGGWQVRAITTATTNWPGTVRAVATRLPPDIRATVALAGLVARPVLAPPALLTAAVLPRP